MPTGAIPERFHDILRSTALAHLATTDSNGRPQVNPIWFIWESGQLLISVLGETQKYRNLRRDPHVAVSFLDMADTHHYVELRGEAVDFELFLDLTFVNRLSRKYTGVDFPGERAGQERYKVTIRADSWTGQ